MYIHTTHTSHTYIYRVMFTFHVNSPNSIHKIQEEKKYFRCTEKEKPAGYATIIYIHTCRFSVSQLNIVNGISVSISTEVKWVIPSFSY